MHIIIVFKLDTGWIHIKNEIKFFSTINFPPNIILCQYQCCEPYYKVSEYQLITP